MNRNALHTGIIFLAIALSAIALSACSSPQQPVVTPPEPVFVTNSTPPDTIDQGMYADYVDVPNGIDIQWRPDSTNTTTGYLLFRSINDSSVGSNGILAHGTMIADIENSNQLIVSLDTSFVDTVGITPGATYYYQLQAFNRSPTNSLAYSHPTHPGISTSFTYAQRVQLFSPSGNVSLKGFPLQFLWQDPNNGGSYQIIIQRLDNQEYVWSYLYQEYESNVAYQYPTSATPLIPGVPYQWRVKWTEPNGGSSSAWVGFNVSP